MFLHDVIVYVALVVFLDGISSVAVLCHHMGKRAQAVVNDIGEVH